jgi:hypothetical protein
MSTSAEHQGVQISSQTSQRSRLLPLLLHLLLTRSARLRDRLRLRLRFRLWCRPGLGLRIARRELVDILSPKVRAGGGGGGAGAGVGADGPSGLSETLVVWDGIVV